MNTPSLRLIALLALLTVASAFAGCQQQSLFADDDIATQNRLRYFGNESARQTSESRRQTAQWGFGFPTGPGDQ